MAISIISPTNGSNIGCVLYLRIACTTRKFYLSITYNNYVGGCRPGLGTTTTKKLELGPVNQEPIIGTRGGKNAQSRNGQYHTLIPLCNLMGQTQLCRGNSITITVTDEAGNTASVTVTLRPDQNNGRHCNCPGNQ